MNAIYVGLPEEYPHSYPERHPLYYGMTGECRNHEQFWSFRPDGQTNGHFVCRDDIYIPKLDATRYCPKL